MSKKLNWRLACQHSIQRNILCWSLAVILIGGSISIISAIYTTKHESDELFDANLIQAMSLLDTLLPHTSDDYELFLQRWQFEQQQVFDQALLNNLRTHIEDDDEEESVEYFNEGFAIAIQEQSGELLYSSQTEFQPNQTPATGFSIQEANESGWRVLTLYDEKRQLWLSTAQTMSLRNTLGLEINFSFIPSILTAGGILCILIILIVHRGLKPLNELSENLHSRDANDLTALSDQDLPAELKTPVKSINSLFQRVNSYVEQERRFTDNAAHELRTPLAAFKVQMEGNDPNQQGVQRMERLINQLLDLARLSPKAKQAFCGEAVQLQQVAADTIADLYPAALKRSIDIELESPDTLEVSGQPVLLGAMLRNLLENAIRYSKEGDTINVTLEENEQGYKLQVIDHGPGLSEAEKEQVFERFYRGNQTDRSGAGLGMTIVQNILELHQASYSLSDTAGGGLTITIDIPNKTDNS